MPANDAPLETNRAQDGTTAYGGAGRRRGATAFESCAKSCRGSNAEDKALSALGQSTTPTGPSEAIPTADSRAIAAEGFSYALRRCLFRARTRTHGARATMRSPRDYLTRVRLRRNGTGRATPTRVRRHRPSAPLSRLGRPNRPCPTQRQTTPIASMPRPDR